MLCHVCEKETSVVIVIDGIFHCPDCDAKRDTESDDKDTKHELRQTSVP